MQKISKELQSMLIQENMAILDFLDVFLFEKYFYIYFDFNQFILINFQMYFTKNYKLN